jgi:hypothetical protein
MARLTNKPDAPDGANAAPKEAKPDKPASQLTRETVVYLGPNHPAGYLSHGQVFKSPLLGPVAEVLNKAPEIMGPLFVPLSGLVKAKHTQADPGSDLNRAFKKAAEHLAGGK